MLYIFKDLLLLQLLVTFVKIKAPMSWKTIFFTILTVLLVIFTIQNHLLVNLKFLSWELKDVPLIFVLLSGLVFGFLLASVMQLPRIMKLKRELNLRLVVG